MSVLIKGMEIPTSCFDCPFMYGRKYCRANSKIEFNDPDYSELKGRYDGCPLVPVPPGRLIDSTIIERAMTKACNECRESCIEFDGFYADCENCIFCDVVKALHDAPTIIPAEEEGEI